MWGLPPLLLYTKGVCGNRVDKVIDPLWPNNGHLAICYSMAKLMRPRIAGVVICIDAYRFGSSCPSVLVGICTSSLRGRHGDTSPGSYRARDDRRLGGQTHLCQSDKHPRRQVFISTYKPIKRYNTVQLHDTT